MTRKLKVLGLAVFAAMAITAIAASAAQAFEHIGKPSSAIKLTVTPDGTGTTAHQVFDAAGASITCPGVTGEASIAAGPTNFNTVTAEKITYTGECKFVGQKATVSTAGCDYNFVHDATPTNITTVFVKCEAGKEIEFSVPSPVCKVTVPEQGPLSSITLHNPNANEVTVEAHVTGIKYTAVGAGCPTPGTQTNGNYTTGNFLLTGEENGGNMVKIQAT